ncbi:unnamed protein product [Rotaria sp. Silwood1]|nr:unnamed protein product [Rotaria sp. Silwood1]CAF1029367.1 unnamed protein product [Rotaria sp. Silwood1]CAF3422236.1 unnamed protein product [Rotaria sp. Silwood1]CAF4878158.1 unnamed protein product [Rotaria sp. Silwood1]
MFSNTEQVDHVHFNLTLVRHAETHANAEGIIQGLLDTELSNIGYQQSKALGRYLQYHHFSHIYSSDLKRSLETARQIHQLNRVSSCKIKFDSLLRERMFGIAEGRTRRWLHELAKENGIPYINFTPPGAETTAQVRERAIKFFRKLCQEIFIKFGTFNLLTKQDTTQCSTCNVSTENLFITQKRLQDSNKKRSISIENIHNQLKNHIILTRSCRSTIDSTMDLSSLSNNSNSEKQRILNKTLKHSSYENHFSDLDVLVVSHGSVIRELIKYFAHDLQTDIGQHIDTIQELAPNASVTRFHVIYSINEQLLPTTTVELIDYHNKNHLINIDNEEFNLDTTNK